MFDNILFDADNVVIGGGVRDEHLVAFVSDQFDPGDWGVGVYFEE